MKANELSSEQLLIVFTLITNMAEYIKKDKTIKEECKKNKNMQKSIKYLLKQYDNINKEITAEIIEKTFGGFKKVKESLENE